MAAKKTNPAFEFTREYLTQNPKASFVEVRDAAAKKKMVLYPIMYGRAQVLLGLVKQAPRGQGKAKLAKEARAAGVVKRGPGRPRKYAAPVAAAAAIPSGLDGIVAAVKASEQERARYRATLERIQAILADALR